MLVGRVTEVATGRSGAELRFDLARYGWNRTSGLAGVNGGTAGSVGGHLLRDRLLRRRHRLSTAAGTSSGGLVAASPRRRPVTAPTANVGRTTVRRVLSDAGRARIRIRILGRCRAGQDQGPRLPAPPARLIRVGLPVLEGLPCGGGRPGMAQPPPPRTRRQSVRDGRPPGGKRDQHLDIRGRRLYTLQTNAAAVLAVSNRSDRQASKWPLEGVPPLPFPASRGPLSRLPGQIETRPNDFVIPPTPGADLVSHAHRPARHPRVRRLPDMPLSNNADDRRGVRNGRPKAAARARRRASAPYLESLESRALLSVAGGQAPRCRRRGAAVRRGPGPGPVHDRGH